MCKIKIEGNNFMGMLQEGFFFLEIKFQKKEHLKNHCITFLNFCQVFFNKFIIIK